MNDDNRLKINIPIHLIKNKNFEGGRTAGRKEFCGCPAGRPARDERKTRRRCGLAALRRETAMRVPGATAGDKSCGMQAPAVPIFT